MADVEIPHDAKAEVVINLAKAWGIGDGLIRQELSRRFGPDAADHAYFHWTPRPRFPVGTSVRVVAGAPQVLGQSGRVTALDDPKMQGVRGMGRGFYYTVVFHDAPDAWGFQEEQLEAFE